MSQKRVVTEKRWMCMMSDGSGHVYAPRQDEESADLNASHRGGRLIRVTLTYKVPK